MIKLFLDYQDTDKQLLAIDKELRASPERHDYATYKKAVNDANLQVQKLDRDCEELIHLYNKAKSSLDAILAEINELTDASQSIGDSVEEYDFYTKNIDKLLSQRESIEAELTKLVKAMEEKKKEFDKVMDYGRKVTLKLKDAKAKYQELELSKKDEVDSIREKLATLEVGLDATLLSTYKQLRSMNVFPVFVPKIGDSCRGCGMELPRTSLDELADKGHADCPNCHRIVYME